MPSTTTAPLFDLHLHTYWSYDATAGPEAYLRAAVEQGVGCLAITDHHNVDGLAELQTVAAAFPVRVIPAAELTVHTSIGSVDLLCYNLPLTPTPALAAVYHRYHQWQQERAASVIRAMQRFGHDYTETHHRELLKSYRPARVLNVQGLTHIQNARQRAYFMERGFIADEAGYTTAMEDARKAGLLTPYPEVGLVTAAVKEAGALIVIAHPRGYFQGDDRRRMDQLREECALDGIECAHPSTPPELGTIYRRYCVEHGLCSTAGSDTHHEEKIPETFGRFSGEPAWLDEFLERIA